MSNRKPVTKPRKSKIAVFTSEDAKVAMIQRKQTVTGLADKFSLARNTVSMAINRGLFPRVRQLIAKELGLS